MGVVSLLYDKEGGGGGGVGFFFFFQAEDGIRDWSVTGVQTCALPILIIQQSICRRACTFSPSRNCIKLSNLSKNPVNLLTHKYL